MTGDSPLAEHTDKSIRSELVTFLRDVSPAGAKLVQEWSVGASRVDVAVVHPDRLDAYEIKSPRDSLTRLVPQMRDYGRVFDHVTLVADPRHIIAARRLVPFWVGLWSIELGDSRFNVHRRAQPNPMFHGRFLCWLLWHREMRVLMQRRCLDWRTHRSKYEMARCITTHLEPSELRAAVVSFLHARTDWKDVNDGARGSRWI